MLTGEDIICFTHTAWHGPWKASQQIMSLLAESNRVLYIGPPMAMREALNSVRNGTRPSPVLEHIRPTLLLYHGRRILARIRENRPLGPFYNRGIGWVRMWDVRSLAWRLGFRNPILWIFDPMQAKAAGRFREKLLVYHVLDNYGEFPKPSMAAARVTIVRNEERLLKNADVVFSVSSRLNDRCRTYNSNSFHVPNGVNYRTFQMAIATGAVPSELQGLRRPIIGYVGVIQSDLDFTLIRQLAEDFSEGSLVFVGPEDLGDERPQFEALLRRQNIHYLGPKPVDDVPLYINACDVCIMPYLPDRSAADSDQIKLYEYLACGRPIVATDLPSAQNFVPFVRIGKNANEFVAHVKASLEENSSWAEQRKRVASQHAWQHRVTVLSETIMKRISRNVNGGGQP